MVRNVQELVPEMFYLPELLLNCNILELGKRQDGEELGHVRLPPWARGSAWRFVRTMRQALESPHASRELPAWIDLIFGCKQQGEAAVGALNVFFYTAYANKLQLDQAEPTERLAIRAQVQHFGQSPAQLWRERPHPRRDRSAALNTMQLVPLLVALASETPLACVAEFAVEPWGGLAVRALAASSPERVMALTAGGVIVPQQQQILLCGLPDGAVRACAYRSGPGGKPLATYHGMHGGRVVVALAASPGLSLLVSADLGGEIAIWTPSARAGGQIHLSLHGRLRGRGSSGGHVALAISAVHRTLASATADGVLLLWDTGTLRLMHVLRVCTPSGACIGARGDDGDALKVLISDATGEVAVGLRDELQLWSINGALLARTAERFPPLRCVSFTPTPEWMYEQLPVLVSGHQDGTVRWWCVREPAPSVATARPGGPGAISSVPAGAGLLPTWELAECTQLRLQAPCNPAPVPVTSVCVADSMTKLLWTGLADGRVLSWQVHQIR